MILNFNISIICAKSVINKIKDLTQKKYLKKDNKSKKKHSIKNFKSQRVFKNIFKNMSTISKDLGFKNKQNFYLFNIFMSILVYISTYGFYVITYGGFYYYLSQTRNIILSLICLTLLLVLIYITSKLFNNKYYILFFIIYCIVEMFIFFILNDQMSDLFILSSLLLSMFFYNCIFCFILELISKPLTLDNLLIYAVLFFFIKIAVFFSIQKLVSKSTY